MSASVDTSHEPVTSVTPAHAHASDRLLIDIRDGDSFELVHAEGAVHRPLHELPGGLEERYARAHPLALICDEGLRSISAAQLLRDAGFTDVVSVAGGIRTWARDGLPVAGTSTQADEDRHARQVRLPQVGRAGQARLRAARVLVIGAGGLGSPALLYLAAAGVGTIGIVDDDTVERSNLSRQIIHAERRLRTSKVASAEAALRQLDSEIDVRAFATRFSADTADELLASEQWDVVIDATDNLASRYAISDAARAAGMPVVHGSAARFEGRVTVLCTPGGPCYRCLFPEEPAPQLVESCSEQGVLGAVPGVIGSLQGLEALKLILDIGSPLVGRLLIFDALESSFSEVGLTTKRGCESCDVRR